MKHKKLFKILGVLALVLVCAASIVIPIMTNADGGGGAGTGGTGSGAAAEGQQGGMTYVWHDDPSFTPTLDGSNMVEPDQGWCTRTTGNNCTPVTDATYNFWISKLSDNIGGTALTWFNSSRWTAIRETMTQACMNALARDPDSNHARIVGVAVVWNNYPYANGDVSYPAWIPGWGNNIQANPRTFDNLFGNTVPSASWLSTSSNNDWSGVVDRSYFNGALEGETWNEYIYRIGAMDNNNESLWTQDWVFYVVAATDNMPFRQIPKDAYLQITKTVPSGYSATGATFGVYNSEANANSDSNRVTTLTIGSDGKSQLFKYSFSGSETSKTLYIKELTAPTQTGSFTWIKDPSVKSITLTKDNTESNPGTQSFSNNIQQYGYIRVKKTVPTGYSAQGATFGVYASQANANADTNRLTTLTIGSNGVSGTYRVALPVGTGTSQTVYVKELSVPAQSGDFDWIIDNGVKSHTITASNTETSPYEFNISNNVNEYGYLQVIKTVPAGYKAQGATFGVYDSQANANANTNKLTTLTIGANGKSNVYRYKLPVGVNQSKTLYVKELTNPTQSGDFDWVIDSSVKSIAITKTASTSPKTITVNNDVIEYAYLRIQKTVPSGYAATGATFGVYSSEANANANTGRLAVLTIGSDGYSTTTFRTALPKGVSKSITLYVKELTSPTQSGNFTWNIDSSVKSKSLTSANNKNAPAIITVNNTVQEYGFAEMIKTAPSGYKPGGAEYTIYSDAACTTVAPASYFANGTVQKFVIGASGTSNQIKFNVPTGGSRTVYVKETTKPSQAEVGFDWVMDSNVYTLKMTKANTTSNPARATSKNSVIEYGYGFVTKISDVVSKQALVDGAQFTVYMPDGTTIAKDYKTGANVVLTVANGKTSTFCLKVGNYILKETRVPAEFDRADDRPFAIEKNKTTELRVTNHYQKAEVYVLKTTNREDMLSKYPLVGTKIGVYVDPECTTLAVDVLTGEQCILTVKDNMQSNKVTLGLGKYYFKEISTTQWYELSTEVLSKTLNEDGKTYEVQFKNILKPGLGQVEKGFK